MRKLLLFLTALITVSFVACEAENENVTSSQNTKNEELLTTTSGGIRIIHLKPYRKSRDCKKGFGVCEFCMFCDKPDKPDMDRAVEELQEQIDNIPQTYIGTSSTSHDSHFEFPITDEDDREQIGQNLIIEEDVISNEGDYKIVQGEYIYQSDIGKNGGYRIHLVKN